MHMIILLLVGVLTVTVTYVLSKVVIRSSSSSRSWKEEEGGGDQIPGGLGLPFLGETLSFLFASYSTKGCYDFIRGRRIRHGKWFKTRVFGRTHVYVPSVEGAKAVLSKEFEAFNKGYFKSMADGAGRNSVFCVPEEHHKRIRRLLSDPFSMNSLSVFIQRFDKILCERLNRLHKDGKSFSVLQFTLKLTFDAMCDMLMSITDASLLSQIERDITTLSYSILSVPLMIPGTSFYKGAKARERLMKTFETMIAYRRSSAACDSPKPEDFLQSMLDRDSFPINEKLDDSEIMDNLLTFILAGQSTTATALMWCVKFLDENPKVQEKLREEQLSILRNKPENAYLTQEDLSRMSFGSKVVKETLRMSNVVMWYPRVAVNDCIIQGFQIKKGWNVDVDASCIHYDPTLYKDPLQFNPNRFDEPQKPYSFIPFSAGARTCMGINMANMTMLVFLHRLTSGYKWTVDDQDPSLKRMGHIPQLRSGCPITLTSLKDAKSKM